MAGNKLQGDMGKEVALWGLTLPLTWAQKAKKLCPEIFASAFLVNSNGKATNMFRWIIQPTNSFTAG